MANFIFNVARGRLRYFYAAVNANIAFTGAAGPPETLSYNSTANAALIIVLLETTGLEADATLADYDDLSALLAGASNEQTTMGRKTLTDADLANSAVTDADNRLDLDIPDQTWVAASGNAVSKLLVCFDPDTTAGSDTTVVPLTAHDFVVTPVGSAVTAQISAVGFYRSGV